jgi:hypothetical protein
LSKRNLIIVSIVFIAVISVFSAKIFAERSNKVQIDSATLSLEEQYEKIIKSSKPSIIIFSYEGDCCESTKKFFDEYNSKARKIVKEYEGKFETLFIDTANIIDKKDNDALMKIAKAHNVSGLPSLLILDSKGTALELFESIFDETEVIKSLDEVVS